MSGNIIDSQPRYSDGDLIIIIHRRLYATFQPDVGSVYINKYVYNNYIDSKSLTFLFQVVLLCPNINTQNLLISFEMF